MSETARNPSLTDPSRLPVRGMGTIPDEGEAGSYRLWAQSFGAFVFALGVLVLLGWALDVAVLKSILPSWVTMKANTALAFVLSGASLFLLSRARNSKAGADVRRAIQAPWTGRVLGAGAALIGLLTLIEYIFRCNLGIDQLLFREAASAVATYSPGRMALTTAISFSCSGLALVFMDARMRLGRFLTQCLMLPVVGLALLSLVGYTYSQTSFYRFGLFTAQALHTATAFAVLSAGVLLARPQHVLASILSDKGPGGVVVRRLLPMALLVPLVLGWLRVWGEQVGHFESHIGVALVACCYIAILTALTLWVAGSLRRRDIERKKAERELLQIGEARERGAQRQVQLSALQQELLGPGSLDEKLKKITDAVVSVLDADFSRIWITQQGDRCEAGCVHATVTEGPHVCRHRDRCLHLKASSGRYTHLDGEGHRRVPFGCYKIGKVASGQEPKFLTNDVTHDPRVHNHPWAAELGLVSFAGYQLRPPGGDTLGVLALFSRHPISPEEDALLDMLGHTTAQVVGRAGAEAALRQSEQRLALHFQQTPLGVIEWDTEFRVVRWNPGAERILGHSNGEAIGHPSSFVVPPQAREQVEEVWSSLLARKGGARSTNLNVTKDGRIILCEWYNTLLEGADGKIIGVSSLFQDITERKNLEQQLLQGQKLEAVGRLASGVAHEINTPMQYVGDNVRFLQRSLPDMAGLVERVRARLANGGMTNEERLGLLDAFQKADAQYLTVEISKAIEQSLQGIAHVTKIVGAMKDFSHPNTDKKELISLNQALETTIAISRNEWKYVADVVTNPEQSLPAVPGLPGELNQVFLNVLINAAQAIEEAVGKDSGRKGTITVTTRSEKEWVEARIADTGKGIPDAVRGKVFDPFFTTKDVGRGSGQGLAIARSVVVEKHGGTLTFETEEGKGTTFIIRLPRVDPGAGKENT